jgi:hypothetical protein
MPRPTSKTDLLIAIEKEKGALDAQLESMDDVHKIVSGIVGVWSVKDVLAHLTAWQQMCLTWYRAGLRDEIPVVPAPGFKWNQTPELNQRIYEEFRDIPLDEILSQFEASHQEILGVIQLLSNKDMFSAGRYRWTKKNTLGTYIVSATSSHYLWARKEIRKGMKAWQA